MICRSLFSAFDHDLLINRILTTQKDLPTYCRESFLHVRMLTAYMGLSIDQRQGKSHEIIIRDICIQFSQQLCDLNLECTRVSGGKVILNKNGSGLWSDDLKVIIPKVLDATTNILRLLNTGNILFLFKKMLADLNHKTQKREQLSPTEIGQNIITCVKAILLTVINPIIIGIFNETNKAEFLLLSVFIQSAGNKVGNQNLPPCLQNVASDNGHALLFSMLTNFYSNTIIPDEHRIALREYLTAPSQIIEQQPAAILVPQSLPPVQMDGSSQFTMFSAPPPNPPPPPPPPSPDDNDDATKQSP